MNPYLFDHTPPTIPHLTLASLLAMNTELNARNDLLLAKLRKVAAEDEAFRQKHLGCDLTIEALQEENEELKKELRNRKKRFERAMKEETAEPYASKRKPETMQRSIRSLRQNTSPSPDRQEEISKSSLSLRPSALPVQASPYATAPPTLHPSTDVNSTSLKKKRTRPPPGILPIPTTIHSSFPSIDPKLKGQAFFDFLKDNRFIKEYDDHFFYCYCELKDPNRNPSKKHKGYTHLHEVGKPYRASRWCTHAARCAYIKDPTEFEGL